MQNSLLATQKQIRNLLHSIDVRLRPQKYYSERPPDFFIIGMQKSGTYWVTALLNSHPQITSIPPKPGGQAGVREGHFFDSLSDLEMGSERSLSYIINAHNGFFNDLQSIIKQKESPEVLNMLRMRYNAHLLLHKKPGSQILGDKTTEYVMHLNRIDQLYPKVKKLAILRDHCDRCLSFHFHQIRKGRRDNRNITLYDVEEYCERIISEYSSLVSYDNEVLLFTYEELSTNPISVLRVITNYLEVDQTDRVLTGMKESAEFKNITKRSRGVQDNASHFRKGIVGEGKMVMSPKMIKNVHSKLDDLTDKVAKKYHIDLSSYIDN